MIHGFLPPTKKKPLGFAISLLFLLCLVPYTHAQQGINPYHQNLLEKLRNYTTTQGPEKVYVQTDKELYGIGETIWFKAYLVDGIIHT